MPSQKFGKPKNKIAYFEWKILGNCKNEGTAVGFDVFDVSRRCQKLSKAFAKNGACHIELKSLVGWKEAAEKFNDFLQASFTLATFFA